MTKDQITRWATQARLPHDYEKQLPMWFDQLSEFADLVATHERLACANVAKQISDKYAYGYYGNEVDTADEIEKAIRARGEA